MFYFNEESLIPLFKHFLIRSCRVSVPPDKENPHIEIKTPKKN